MFLLALPGPNFDDGGCCDNHGSLRLGMALSKIVHINIGPEMLIGDNSPLQFAGVLQLEPVYQVQTDNV